MASSSNPLSLARFAFNIYGSLSLPEKPLRHPEPPASSADPLKSFVYSSDRELTALAQFTHPLGRLNSSYYDASSFVPSLHVVLGGKNFLKLLVLNRDQSGLMVDLNVIDPSPNQRLQLIPKFFNVNTIKCNADLIACGLTNGNVHIFQVAGNGRSKLAYRLDDHKRVVNSLDFVELEQLVFSGSQDGLIRLWDLRLCQKPAIKLLASQHSDPVRSCQVSPHLKVRGKLTVLSVHDSGSLCKFDLRNPPSSTLQSVLPERKWTFHTGPALSLHIHPELEYVLTGGRDRKICLWNYAESLANAKAPELIMNTYGPVMKIRWNDIPNSEPEPVFPGNAGDEADGRSMALYNYDFACLYLNDDPTVTVYNLARRYVPKEIITTGSKKPIQNFSWANGNNGERRLWTISKANNFVSYNLDNPTDLLANILRTRENLPVVATAWSEGYANMAFVNQNTEDYDMAQLDQDYYYTEDTSPGEYRAPDENMHFSRSTTNLAENLSMNTYTRPSLNSLLNQSQLAMNAMSPKEKQANFHNSYFNPGTKSPSPISHHRLSVTEINSVMSPMRPSLKNTPSQSTIDSNALSAIYMQPLASHNTFGSQKQWTAATPSLISLNVPVVLADDTVFKTLASNYLISIPDSFSISFVCQVNAQVAESVGRQRDSNMWNLLAAALEQEKPQERELRREQELPRINVGSEVLESNAGDEMKSLCSELDNFVALYNSNSTLTTNYGGGGPKSNASTTSMTKGLLLTSKDSFHLGDYPLVHSKQSRTGQASNSNVNGEKVNPPKDNLKSPQIPLEPVVEPSKVDIDSVGVFESQKPDTGKIIDTDTDDKHSIAASEPANELDAKFAPMILPVKLVRKNKSLSELHSIKAQATQLPISNPFALESKFASPDFMGEDQSPQSRARRPKMHRGYSFASPTNFQKIPLLNPLINEKTQGFSASLGASPGSLVTHALYDGSYPSSRRKLINQPRPHQFVTNHSNSSVGSLPIPFVDGFTPPVSHDRPVAFLDRVDETSIKSKDPVASELTRAINQVNLDAQRLESRRPWYSLNLIKKALQFSVNEGDLVTAATFVLLFCDTYPKEFFQEVLSENQSLECLGAYIDALRRKELFTIAVNVVKEAPSDLKYQIGLYASKEVDMNFYCCWCLKLLVNEHSKSRFGAKSENYGYWYCDECSKRQLNCVYCNEPCKGLTVSVDLICGHRGHFGCLKEWFIEDGNTSCPGGCEK